MTMTAQEFKKFTDEVVPLITEERAAKDTLKEIYKQYSSSTGIKPADVKKLAECAYAHTLSEEAAKHREMAALFESFETN